MKPALLYARFSPRRHAEDCESIETQVAAITKYCGLVGLGVGQVLEDRAVSGDVPLEQRPGGAELVRLIHSRAAQDVIIHRLDRCFRDVVDCLTQVEQWDKLKCTLHIVNFGGATINTRSAMGRTMLTVGAAFAELEKNLIRERTSCAMLRHQLNGRRMSDRPPFGWEDDPDPSGPRHDETGRPLRMRECPSEQASIERLKELRATGMSFKKIANQMAFEGWKPRRSRWHTSLVHRLLTRDAS